MGLFPNHYQLIHSLRLPSYATASPSTEKRHLLPILSTTSTSESSQLRLTPLSLPLTFLSAATATLFIFTCWLATTQTSPNLNPDTFHQRFDEHDSLGMLIRPRGPAVYESHQSVFDLSGGREKNGQGARMGVVKPEIRVWDSKEVAGVNGGSRLWFKAEYTVEIPICSGHQQDTAEYGGGCIRKDDSGFHFDTKPMENGWIPASESVRVSFCTAYAAASHEEGDNEELKRGNDADWEEGKSWDYMFPPSEGPTEGDWVFGVDKRPLERWRTVDIPGRAHDTSFHTHMIIPKTSSGGWNKPQWQFLLTTEGVYINADAWNVFEEEVVVEVPIERSPSKRDHSSEKDNKPTEAEVAKVAMWRWKGRYGGCPGEMDARNVVLEVNAEESEQLMEGGEGEEDNELVED